MDQGHGHDPVVEVLEQGEGLGVGGAVHLEEDQGGDDGEVVLDPVVDLLEENLLFPKGRLNLVLSPFPLRHVHEGHQDQVVDDDSGDHDRPLRPVLAGYPVVMGFDVAAVLGGPGHGLLPDPDRHPVPHQPAACQDVHVGQDGGAINPGDLRNPGPNPGGDHHG